MAAAARRERSKDMSLAKFSTIFRRGSKKGAQRFWLFTARVWSAAAFPPHSTPSHTHSMRLSRAPCILYIPRYTPYTPHQSLSGCITADAPDPVEPLIKYVSWMKTAQGKGHKAPIGPTREEQNKKNKNTQIYINIYYICTEILMRERKPRIYYMHILCSAVFEYARQTQRSHDNC